MEVRTRAGARTPLVSTLIVGALALTASFAAASKPTRATEPDGGTTPFDPTVLLSFQGESILEGARGAFAIEPANGPQWLELGAGYAFDPLREDPTDRLGAALLASPVSGSEIGTWLVQFDGAVTRENGATLAGSGATIIAYIPDHAFLVRGASASADRLSASADVRWVGPYHPAYKLSRQERMSDPAQREFRLLLFPDASIDRASDRIAERGFTVREVSENAKNKILRVEGDIASLVGLAQMDEVQWIEPHVAPQWQNSSAQWVVQTNLNNNRRVWDLGIRGQGEFVGVSDSGIRTSHNQFFDAAVPLTTFGDYPTHRKIIAYKKNVESTGITFGDESLNSYHGTHTSGTAAGNDAPNAADARDGMAIDAKIYFLDGGGSPGGVFVPLDLNDLYAIAYAGNIAGAPRIMTNSWGSDVGGAYDIASMTADQFAWDHKDFLNFFSNGNAGGVNTVGSPATAKNVVSAGGTENGANANQIYTSTSRGPTDDNRRKPTICSPATLSSALGSGNGGYTTLSGTSMASPSMAGATVLIRQYLTDGWYPTGAAVGANAIPTPSASLMKAMAINSADANVTGFTVPDNNIGWGRIDIDNVLYFSGDARRLAVVDSEEGLLTGEFVEYQVYVAANSAPLKAALVWTDYAGTPSASVQLVNNLDLIATDGVTTYKGNVYSGGQSTTGGTADSRNVEECVQRNTPTVGLWTFRIEGVNVPIGPQPFALVVSGALASDQGLLTLDRPSYGVGDVVTVRVIDTNAVGSVEVTLSSDTEAGGETLTIAGANGVFETTVPLTLTPAVNGDGDLTVSDGDVIIASYDDLSPVLTLEAQANVNISGPAISDVNAVGISDSDVTLSWNSSSPANSKVYYGATPALGSESTLDAALVFAHSVALGELAPNTTYYYDVESYDNQGNGVRDDNGGLHYTFSTDTNRDVLVVIGDSTFDRTQSYVDALERTGWSYAVWQGAQSSAPFVGNLATGMASYKAVVFQSGLEQYPMFTDAARDSIAKLHSLGSRTAVWSHDVAWDFCDPTSPDFSTPRCDWIKAQFKVTFQTDPTTFSSVRGIAADPISGAYTAGIPYTPHRDGAACDEIDGIATGGSFNNVWRDNDVSVDDIAVRWQSAGNIGSVGQSVWGGTPRRVSTNLYEWSGLNVGTTDDLTRADVLDKTLIWLIGHDHPEVTLSAPNGGENITGSSVNIAWTESVAGGFAVGSRQIYYSINGGDQWTLISGAAGPSPFVWNVTALPNGAQYRVRIVVNDNGAPALSASDASAANFTINRVGGDTRGPVVLAGSIASNPNPIYSGDAAVLSAQVSDIYTGNSNVAAAEYSVGAGPAPAGSGTAMSSGFGAPLVTVTAALDTGALPAGPITLWVRGRDAANQWGNANSFAVLVNSASGIDDSAAPLAFALHSPSPNPFNPRVSLRFDLPRAAAVALQIHDLSGRRVRTLVEGRAEPGAHILTWDGRDDSGRELGSGVYFCHMEAGAFRATRKLTLLK